MQKYYNITYNKIIFIIKYFGKNIKSNCQNIIKCAEELSNILKCVEELSSIEKIGVL